MRRNPDALPHSHSKDEGTMTTSRNRRTVRNAKNKSAPADIQTDYRSELWRMADALRGSMDAAEYKHVVLGLVFLKYISDAFEEAHAALDSQRGQVADPEDPDEYTAQSIFWVPPEAQWERLKTQARQPEIGRLVDDAMIAVEGGNPALRGVLPKEYGRDTLGYRTPAEVLHGDQDVVDWESNGWRCTPEKGTQSLAGERGFSLNSALILSK